jgi:hypothetical protein
MAAKWKWIVLQRTIDRFDESRELSFAPARGGISTIRENDKTPVKAARGSVHDEG